MAAVIGIRAREGQYKNIECQHDVSDQDFS